jgi:hypothetical protein
MRVGRRSGPNRSENARMSAPSRPHLSSVRRAALLGGAAVALAACSHKDARSAADAELAHDLALANRAPAQPPVFQDTALAPAPAPAARSHETPTPAPTHASGRPRETPTPRTPPATTAPRRAPAARMP